LAVRERVTRVEDAFGIRYADWVHPLERTVTRPFLSIAFFCLAKVTLVSAAAAQESGAWDYVVLDGAIVGWERASISRDSQTDTARVRRFAAFEETNTRLPTPFDALLQDLEFDCAAGTYRVVGGVYANRDFRDVAIMASAEPVAIRPNTTEDMLKALVCDGRPVTPIRSADSPKIAAEQLWSAD